jgi:4-hydroxybenzoate polyprenyltransferase
VIARAWRHPWVRHLRLPFNVLLTPVFAWGVWLGDGALDPGRLVLAYLSLHVFLYGGTNALNSYYDRDEGPIGGMLRPPPVDPGLLRWSWAVQAAGLPLAALVGAPFLVVWLALLAVATAYSHPRWRWKADPVAAVAAVALGQGGLGALAGAWAVADRGRGWGDVLRDLADPVVLTGLAAAAALITGLYVVSQVYQTAEDRRRGDRTWPVLLGPRPALRWAAAASGLGAVLLVGLIARDAGLRAVLPLVPLLLGVGVAQLRWAQVFEEADVPGNFRRSMALVATGGLGLTAYLVWLIAR